MNILDIGTGTGVLALMLAQRHEEAIIDAVEPDRESAAEAKENFETSPWSYRLTCYPESLQSFIEDETLHYDLIVSNPPYFTPVNTQKGNNHQWPDERRLNARTTADLSFEVLLDSVNRVLVEFGKFYVVLPREQETTFRTLAEEKELWVNYRLEVKHDSHQPSHRVILAFQKTKSKIREEELILYNEQGEWTEQYRQLTNSYHAKS
ncbi:MAG: methyltransferase [Bacteroidota bacterium]|nr:methyltransferase [Bacteroidota bacterium]MDX5470640.1 methyltransferase [Bacteroidota bacterium]